ncbi:hypothetical protein P167DRAFT_460708, partial [Morchella conica CCBAS932]
PGQPLAPSSRYIPGTGVHIFHYEICASIVGIPQLSPSSPSGLEQILSVLPCTDSTNKNGILPQVGAIVLGKVTRITHIEATLAIFVVGEAVCTDEFKGIIRREDVRAFLKDKAKILSSFKPGDIVRARIISLGDQSKYFLSTASNDLGVIVAHSESGDPLNPLSWHEMVSQSTDMIEERKVAKPM